MKRKCTIPHLFAGAGVAGLENNSDGHSFGLCGHTLRVACYVSRVCRAWAMARVCPLAWPRPVDFPRQSLGVLLLPEPLDLRSAGSLDRTEREGEASAVACVFRWGNSAGA